MNFKLNHFKSAIFFCEIAKPGGHQEYFSVGLINNKQIKVLNKK